MKLKKFIQFTKLNLSYNWLLILQGTGCPKILYQLVHDIISPNGNGLRIWNSIHINTIMYSLKMSGERTLMVLRNQSYGQIKFGKQNMKNTKVWKFRDDWKVHTQGIVPLWGKSSKSGGLKGLSITVTSSWE